MPNWRLPFASAIAGIRLLFIPHPYFYWRETGANNARSMPRFPSEEGGVIFLEPLDAVSRRTVTQSLIC